MKIKLIAPKKITILLFIFFIFFVCIFFFKKNSHSIEQRLITLPKPQFKSTVSIEEAIKNRRTLRFYSSKQIALTELSQLLWAGQGITHDRSFRAAPSAGPTYPLELFVISQDVQGLSKGIYHYIPHNHSLIQKNNKITIEELYKAAHKQAWVKNAKVIIVVTANFQRTIKKYHQYAPPFVWMEAGHATQNMMLQGVGLNIGMVSVAGFDNNKVAKIMNLGPLQPLYLICIGKFSNNLDKN